MRFLNDYRCVISGPYAGYNIEELILDKPGYVSSICMSDLYLDDYVLQLTLSEYDDWLLEHLCIDFGDYAGEYVYSLKTGYLRWLLKQDEVKDNRYLVKCINLILISRI